jgi:hypothetical protein
MVGQIVNMSDDPSMMGHHFREWTKGTRRLTICVVSVQI